MSVFETFRSKENINIIRENIESQIEKEYNQKFGHRYDLLIENKMKELISKIPEKVPEDRSKKDYLLQMNKKLIQMVLPTIKANAIKERPKQEQPRKPAFLDDPQDILQRNGAREQFNLPLEDMSNRFIPDYPRTESRNDFQRNMDNSVYQTSYPSSMPKFQDDLPNKRNDDTLAMFNQLKSKYEEEKIKVGEVPENMDIYEKPSNNIQQQQNQTSFFPKKKIVMKKSSKLETPIEDLIQNDDDQKVKDLLTVPTIFPQNQTILHQNVVPNNQIVTKIYFSSNFRNFDYHKSPSSIRIYLTPYFDNIYDPFIYFTLPEFVNKYNHKIYNEVQIKNDTKHYLNINSLKNLKSLKINFVEILNPSFTQNNKKIFIDVSPKLDSIQNFQSVYHNHSSQKRDLLLLQNSSFYENIFSNTNDYIDIQQVIKNGYIQFNLYDIYGKYIHFENDIFYFHSIISELKNNQKHISISFRNNISSFFSNNDKIYFYSLLPPLEQNSYVEFGDTILIDGENLLLLENNKFKLCALNILDDDNQYKIDFKDLFDKTKLSMEDDEHKSIQELFYIVILQNVQNKRIYYYCNIEYIDELGNLILSHKNATSIVENYENTEQFGFIKKNFNGTQYDDISSLYRFEGYIPNNIIYNQEKNETYLEIICNENECIFDEFEGFIRFDKNEINISCELTFSK